MFNEKRPSAADDDELWLSLEAVYLLHFIRLLILMEQNLFCHENTIFIIIITRRRRRRRGRELKNIVCKLLRRKKVKKKNGQLGAVFIGIVQLGEGVFCFVGISQVEKETTTTTSTTTRRSSVTE